MCAGSSCAACNANDLASPCAHNVDERHRGSRTVDDVLLPVTRVLLADRIEVDPADPDSVAHFLETWAQIVRTRRHFIIILQ